MKDRLLYFEPRRAPKKTPTRPGPTNGRDLSTKDAYNFVEILCVPAGVAFAFMGYLLFAGGVNNIGQARFSGSGEFAKLVLTGTAPGLFLMLVGATVVLTAIAGSAYGRQKGSARALDLLADSYEMRADHAIHRAGGMDPS